MTNKYEDTLANIGMYILEHTLFKLSQFRYFRDHIDEEQLFKELSESQVLKGLDIAENVKFFKSVKHRKDKITEIAAASLSEAIIFKNMLESYPNIMECFDKKMKKPFKKDLIELVDMLRFIICPSLDKKNVN